VLAVLAKAKLTANQKQVVFVKRSKDILVFLPEMSIESKELMLN
jgi:hypothetical protein